MPVIVTETTSDRPIITLPRALPVAGSRSLRSIDLLGLCKCSTRSAEDTPYNPHRGDQVNVEFGVIGEQKIFYFSYMVCGVGSAFVRHYPEAATLWTLTQFFQQFERELKCDPTEIAQAMFDNAPWAT